MRGLWASCVALARCGSVSRVLIGEYSHRCVQNEPSDLINKRVTVFDPTAPGAYSRGSALCVPQDRDATTNHPRERTVNGLTCCVELQHGWVSEVLQELFRPTTPRCIHTVCSYSYAVLAVVPSFL